MKYANTCVKEILFDLSISLVVSIQLPASLVLPATIPYPTVLVSMFRFPFFVTRLKKQKTKNT